MELMKCNHRSFEAIDVGDVGGVLCACKNCGEEFWRHATEDEAMLEAFLRMESDPHQIRWVQGSIQGFSNVKEDTNNDGNFKLVASLAAT